MRNYLEVSDCVQEAYVREYDNYKKLYTSFLDEHFSEIEFLIPPTDVGPVHTLEKWITRKSMIRMNLLLDNNRPTDQWASVGEDLMLYKADFQINWASRLPNVGCVVVRAKFRLRCSDGIRARFEAISNVYECINRDLTHDMDDADVLMVCVGYSLYDLRTTPGPIAKIQFDREVMIMRYQENVDGENIEFLEFREA